MKQGFEKAKADVWARFERESEIRFPPELRALLEQSVGFVDEETFLKDLPGLLDDRREEWRWLMDHLDPRKKTERSANTKRYQRCFEKRLHVVEFVLESQWRAPKTKRKSPACSRRKHFDWRYIRAEWNKAYPHDPMSSAVIKAKFYRAIAEKDLTEECGKRLFERCAQGHEPTLAMLKESMKESPLKWFLLICVIALGLYAKEAQNERTHTQKR